MTAPYTTRFREKAGYCDWCRQFHKGRCLFEQCLATCDEMHDKNCPNRDRKLCIRCDNFADEGDNLCEDCGGER